MPGTDHVKKVGGSRKSLAWARSLPPPWLPRWVIGKHFRPAAIWRPGSGLFPSSIRRVARSVSAGSQSRAIDICDGCSSLEHGCHSIRAAARYETALARAYHGTSADQGRCCRAGQQDRTYGVGHDGTRRTLQGAEIALGSSIAKSRSRASMNWRGHDDVMQIRSIRGSGEPAWVIALPSAAKRLGPDPRRALGPAAIRAASTGRTRDRTRPMLQNVRKFLPRRRPHVTQSGHSILRIVAGSKSCATRRQQHGH